VKNIKPANSSPQESLVGKNVRIYWPMEGRYYTGKVLKVNDSKRRWKNAGSHVIRYDKRQGMKGNHEVYEWLDGKPTDGKPLEKFSIRRPKKVDYKSLDESLPNYEDTSEDDEFSPGHDEEDTENISEDEAYVIEIIGEIGGEV